MLAGSPENPSSVSARVYLLIVLAVGVGMLAPLGPSAVAQDTLNCDDFDSQFEAQMELNRTFPDDPHNLDADGDWIACEENFGLTAAEEAAIIPADAVNRPPDAPVDDLPPVDDEPLDGPLPVDTTEPVPVAVPVPSSTRVDPPPDVMARVEGCAVIAISSRSIAAAGCPGVGSITYRAPAGSPRMRSAVIINPGAPFTSRPPAAPANPSATSSVDLAQDATERRKKRKKRKRATSVRAADGAEQSQDRESRRERAQKRKDRRGR